MNWFASFHEDFHDLSHQVNNEGIWRRWNARLTSFKKTNIKSAENLKAEI